MLLLSLLPLLCGTAVLAKPERVHERAASPSSTPLYKNPHAAIEDRVEDLLARMTIQEKASQLIQGDIDGWMNMTDPLDNTLTYNETGLEYMATYKAGSIWAGYAAPWEKYAYAINVGQHYMVEKTRLGIPALFQSEGLHGFTTNGTIYPSPPGLAASWNPALLSNVSATISNEAEPLGITHIFAPVLDLGREQRWGRIEENYGEDPFLSSVMGAAFVKGLQTGRRQNASSTALARMAATCKHFTGYGSPFGGLNAAPVIGGEREQRHFFLKPFEKGCVDAGALAIMTSYSSYDGIPVVSDTHLLIDILRNEWGYKYWVTTGIADAGCVDNLINFHYTCETRECAAAAALAGRQGEMGGGTYTYLTIPDQVAAGTIPIAHVDDAVRTILRTKFALGLFESPYPYANYTAGLHTNSTREVLHQMEREAIVLLENNNNVLPLKKSGSVALIGPSADVVSLGDYVFFNSSNYGVTPLDGMKQLYGNEVTINYAEGCKWWSSDESEFPDAIAAAHASDVAVVMVGTWSRDQTTLWEGLNATTGEHVDSSSLGLVGAQLSLVQAIKNTGKPTVVVYVSGRPVAEPWIADNADAIVQQFYPGDLGGIAIAEVLFGDVNPSGKLPLSAPRDVGTTPAYYNYLKGGRTLDPGHITPNGTLVFGHQYILDSPVPLWSFGYGISYTTFAYSNLRLSKSSLKATDTLTVTVNVKNSGSVAGKEVVQAYVTDVVSSVVTPNQYLAGFQKTNELAAGQSVDVSIQIPMQDLAVWTVNSKWVVEPGSFTLRIGSSQEVLLNSTFAVV
ncbi:glycoside hydrolase [Clavulina sp. PMI_390]|nr:glycoside hydrolase [Clavulina sp. PMI_390]